MKLTSVIITKDAFKCVIGPRDSTTEPLLIGKTQMHIVNCLFCLACMPFMANRLYHVKLIGLPQVRRYINPVNNNKIITNEQMSRAVYLLHTTAARRWLRIEGCRL